MKYIKYLYRYCKFLVLFYIVVYLKLIIKCEREIVMRKWENCFIWVIIWYLVIFYDLVFGVSGYIIEEVERDISLERS